MAVGNTGVAAYNAIATIRTLGFSAKADLTAKTSKTTAEQSQVVNTGSNIISNNNGNINILSKGLQML